MTIINNRKATIQLSSIEIKPLSSVYIEDSKWQEMFAKDPVVREMLDGGFIGVVYNKNKKKGNK